MLELRDVVCGYARPVAGPLNLCLQRGQRIGVHGPNGAGKTTLLNAILGRARVHAGTLMVRSRPVVCQPQVPVRLAQMPWTGRELLDVLDATMDGLPRALQDVLDQRVDRLSGGQFQLLGVWSALAGPSKLVLLDEPTSYLDPETSEAMTEAIVAMDAAKSALIVSHDREFLEQTCTDLIRVAGLEPEPTPNG